MRTAPGHAPRTAARSDRAASVGNRPSRPYKGEMDEFDTDDEPVERRLRAERPELSAIELDRVKQGALATAARRGGRGMTLKNRLVLALIVVGLMGTGGGAVIAAS